MNQPMPARSIPLPVWVTVGLYPFYLIFWLGMFIWTPKSEGGFRAWPYVLFMVALPVVVVGLLTGKPFARRRAIGVGGVGLPLVGVALLVVWAKFGGQADDPPGWFVWFFGLVFVLGGVWHWWALTRPAVREWSALSRAKALPAQDEALPSGGKSGTS